MIYISNRSRRRKRRRNPLYAFLSSITSILAGMVPSSSRRTSKRRESVEEDFSETAKPVKGSGRMTAGRSWFRIPRVRLTRQNLLMYAGISVIVIVVFGFLIASAIFAWYARDLPSPGKLSEKTSASTVFYDRNGEIIYELYQDKNRVPVEFKDISPRLKEATIAVEDKNFYKHGGISQLGIMRAAISTIFKGEVQGGSTLTQQLIKNVLLTSERSLSRKVKEAILASEVEKRFTKDEILEMYLNEAPYGGTYWGVGSAAKGYFGKDPKDLNLVESAILAGLPQNPSVYSPFIGVKDRWKGRAKDVLRRMQEDGYITKEEQEKATAQVEKYKFTSEQVSIPAPHFVFFVRDFVKEEFGEGALTNGLKITTTLDLETQEVAQEIVNDEVTELQDEYDLGNGALVLLDSQTHEILSYVGSYDFNNEEYGKFDVVSHGMRQPGSTLKPIVYGLAFEKKYTPSSILMDVDTNFGSGSGTDEYRPVNYDGTFRGPVQMRFALANSLNIPAVKTLALVGVRDFLQLSNDMGLETLAPTDKNLERFGLSIALGGGEVTLLQLTNAFTAFANGGTVQPPQFILEIKDYNNKTIYKRPKANDRRVISEEVSFLVSHILSDDNARSWAFGTGSLLNIPGKTVAVKTGTTDEKRDNWAVGFTKGVTLGVWVGNNDNTQLNPRVASGTTGATSIWHEVMEQMLKKYDDGIIDKPDDVTAVEIDSYLGGLPKDGQPTRSEYYIKGTEPDEVAPYYKKLKVNDGKLANEIQIEAGAYDEKDYIVVTEDDPLSSGDINRWQEGIDAWQEEQEDEKLKPPTEVSDKSLDDVAVNITSPKNRTTVTGEFTVKAKISSREKIKNIKIFMNDTEVKNIDGDTKEISETITVDDGAYLLKIEAENEKGKRSSSTLDLGVNVPWDAEE
ncbi:MAG: transglycosylase domain-containing protein [Patescibacteria group bacterium]